MEMFAYRLGTAHLAKLGINMDGDAHHRAKLGQQHDHEIEPAPSSEAPTIEKAGLKSETSSETEEYKDSSEDTPVMAQIIGIAVLEFGVVLVCSTHFSSCPERTDAEPKSSPLQQHSIIIGLTLALSTDEFSTLYV